MIRATYLAFGHAAEALLCHCVRVETLSSYWSLIYLVKTLLIAMGFRSTNFCLPILCPCGIVVMRSSESIIIAKCVSLAVKNLVSFRC